MYFIDNLSTRIVQSLDLYKIKRDEEWNKLKINMPYSLPGSEQMKYTIEVFRNMFFLKLNIFSSFRMNIKILDNEGNPLYLRQYIPFKNQDIIIDTTGWARKTYSIIFTNIWGTVIASGQFKIARNLSAEFDKNTIFI